MKKVYQDMARLQNARPGANGDVHFIEKNQKLAKYEKIYYDLNIRIERQNTYEISINSILFMSGDFDVIKFQVWRPLLKQRFSCPNKRGHPILLAFHDTTF